LYLKIETIILDIKTRKERKKEVNEWKEIGTKLMKEIEKDINKCLKKARKRGE
jgi:hypothetical protein